MSIEGIKKAADVSLLDYVMWFSFDGKGGKVLPNEYWVELGWRIQSRLSNGLSVGIEDEIKVRISIAGQIHEDIVHKEVLIDELYSFVAHAGLIIGVGTRITFDQMIEEMVANDHDQAK